MTTLEKRQLIAKGCGYKTRTAKNFKGKDFLQFLRFENSVLDNGWRSFIPDKDPAQLLQAIEVLGLDFAYAHTTKNGYRCQVAKTKKGVFGPVSNGNDKSLHTALFNALVNYLMEKS